jgi:hypothetical protein
MYLRSINLHRQPRTDLRPLAWSSNGLDSPAYNFGTADANISLYVL